MISLNRRSVVAGAATLTLGASLLDRARATTPANTRDPRPIAGQGFRLAFEEDFHTLDIGETGHRWAPRLWYERRVSADHFSVANSVLSLKLMRRMGAWEGCNMCTMSTDTRGGTFFRGGYFAARMKLPAAWPAFWLLSVNHARGLRPDANRPATQCAEIDVIEGDSLHKSDFCGTLHSNSSSQGGVADQINRRNCVDLDTDLTRDWHIFSALWTPREVIWYLDEREVNRAAAFPSTWQDMFLILSIEAGGVLGAPQGPPNGADPVELLVDWVRVWTSAES